MAVLLSYNRLNHLQSIYEHLRRDSSVLLLFSTIDCEVTAVPLAFFSV